VNVSLSEGCYTARVVTGPQDLWRRLALADERIADPDVTVADVCPVYGRPAAEVVRAAVLAGTDRANAEFGTSLHPLEIRFAYSGWNNERCGIAEAAAYEIVRAVANGNEVRRVDSSSVVAGRTAGGPCLASALRFAGTWTTRNLVGLSAG
jgi:hypothetical protein